MRTARAFIFSTLATLAVCPLTAGEDLAVSEAYGGFRLDTSGQPPVVASPSAASVVGVTYRAGETVTAVSPAGERTPLVASAASDGALTFSPTSGGLWRLVNSNGETALVGVAWSVFGDAWTLTFDAMSPFAAHTVGDGPDRKGRTDEFPPVAYSGDNWLGDMSAASSVTFVSPSGETTTVDLAGTGAMPFRFGKAGQWTVRLTMSGGTVREASILVVDGFVIILC